MTDRKYEPDVRVKLRFLSTAEGGRKTLAFSNYRPQFFYDGHHYDANHRYPKEGIAPGETTEAELAFLSPRLHQGRIYPGKSFEIYEGAKKVAEGQVLEILALEENARLDRLKNPALYPCPCCKARTLEKRGSFECCPVCFWEDDGQDDHDADIVHGGPNHDLSLTQARLNYHECGAAEPRWVSHVRKPRPGEM